MGEVTTIGLVLAKHVFQVHGVDAEGATILRKQLRRAQGSGVLQSTAALSGWPGGVRDGALLGAGVARPALRPQSSPMIRGNVAVVGMPQPIAH